MKPSCRAFFIAMAMSVLATPLSGSEPPGVGPLPRVSVAGVVSGYISPTSEFVGTVFYREVSEVAAEVSGLAEKVSFEDGQRVRKGAVLVKLGSELLEKQLQATRSTYEQVLIELEREKIDLQRLEKLFSQNSISRQRYDDVHFGVKGLEKRAAALSAQVDRLQLELEKKAIRAPFGGVILKRHVDTGEWLAEGAAVALLARDDVVDVVAEVPEHIVVHVKVGLQADIRVNGDTLSGEVIAVIPRGDISTRTFPVKIRTPNTLSLIEGMSARVSLPAGPREEVLLVPRDALIPMGEKTVVFAIVDAKAKMIPVSVTGYRGLQTGIRSDDLTPGMKIVVRGNERLQDGQQVAVIPEQGGEKIYGCC